MHGGVDPNYTFQMGGGHLTSPNHCHCHRKNQPWCKMSKTSCWRPCGRQRRFNSEEISDQRKGCSWQCKQHVGTQIQNMVFGFQKKTYYPCMVSFVYWRFRCDWNHPELIWWQQHVCWAVCQRTGDDAGPWEAIEKRHWASRMLSCLTTGLQGHWGWSTVLLTQLALYHIHCFKLELSQIFNSRQLKRPSYQSKFQCAVINVFHKYDLKTYTYAWILRGGEICST